MKNINTIWLQVEPFLEEEEKEDFWAALEELSKYKESELADARSKEDWGTFPVYQDDWYKYYSTPIKGVYYAYISQGNWGNHYVVLTQNDIKDLEV